MKNKKVIYTSIFGDINYYLHTPECDLTGWDLICITDNPNIKSDIWDVRLVRSLYTDGARDNRRYKILPHRHFSDYDISVCVDADIKITKNFDDQVQKYLSDCNFSVLDHSICGMFITGDMNRRNCVYEEAGFLKWLGDNNPKKQYKDNMDVVEKQMNKYRSENYPENNGLARTTVIFRRHNETDVKNTMEDWWTEYKYNSRRDQLSFPYVAWKNKFNFSYMNIDVDDNQWFKLMKKWRNEREMDKELNKSIVLIGNASIDRYKDSDSEDIQKKVDSFDNVVRFNRFQIDGYEKYIGSKVTHWVLNNDLFNRGWFNQRYQDEDIERLVVTVVPQNINSKNITDLSGRNSEPSKMYYGLFDELMPNGSIRKKSSRDSKPPVKTTEPCDKPETGILTILHFILKGYKKIYLHNFDFGETFHYYGESNNISDKPNPTHDWNYSKEIVKHFIKQGRLEILYG